MQNFCMPKIMLVWFKILIFLTLYLTALYQTLALAYAYNKIYFIMLAVLVLLLFNQKGVRNVFCATRYHIRDKIKEKHY